MWPSSTPWKRIATTAKDRHLSRPAGSWNPTERPLPSGVRLEIFQGWEGTWIEKTRGCDEKAVYLWRDLLRGGIVAWFLHSMWLAIRSRVWIASKYEGGMELTRDETSSRISEIELGVGEDYLLDMDKLKSGRTETLFI